MNQTNWTSLALDEWSDRIGRRYLGITSSCIIKAKLHHMTLCLDPLPEVKVTGSIIYEHLHKILTFYGIESKIQCAITDNGGAVPACFNFCDIKRFPCVLHTLNIFISHFLQTINDEIVLITKFRTSIVSSCFVAFLKNVNATLNTIPSYIDIRWSSLSKLLDALVELKPLIKRYIIEQDKQDVSEDTWDLIHLLSPIFRDFVHCVKILESDNFGVISHVLPCFRLMHHAIHSLPPALSESIEAYDDIEEQYWNKYKDCWTPVLQVCCRLNPSINHISVMNQEEINIADELIRLTLQGKVLQKSIPQPDTKKQSKYFYLRTENNDIANSYDLYLATMLHSFEDFDLFNFWILKLNTQFHSLAEIALDFLSILASSASAEREFSIASNDIGYRRLKLTEDHVEDVALIALNKKIARDLFQQMNSST